MTCIICGKGGGGSDRGGFGYFSHFRQVQRGQKGAFKTFMDGSSFIDDPIYINMGHL